MMLTTRGKFTMRVVSAVVACVALIGAGLGAVTPAVAATPAACPAGTYQQYTAVPWGNDPLVIGGRNVCAVPLLGPSVGIANTGALAGTWTVPQGVTAIDVIIVAGGGGGGASGHYGITDGYVSGGGGGGGEVKLIALTNLTAGQTMTYSIGAGGAGGQYVESGSKSTDGADGASTSITIGGTTHTVRGGKGGKSGDNGGAGGASGNGNAGGNGVKATSTIGGKSITLGAGGGGGGAATSATGASATTRADAAGTSTLAGEGGACWNPPVASSTYFQATHFGQPSNFYAANALCLGLGGGGATYVTQGPDAVTGGKRSIEAGINSQGGSCTLPSSGSRSVPMAATFGGSGFIFTPTTGYYSGSGAGGGCGKDWGGGLGAGGLILMRFLAPTTPLVKVSGKIVHVVYSATQKATAPVVETDSTVTFTSNPTCGIYATTDTGYTNSLVNTVLSIGTYVNHCSGGSATGATLWYADTVFNVLPPPPSGLSAPTVTAPASNNSNGKLTVSWTAPTSPNGTVTGYTVTASPGGRTCTTTTQLTCSVTGLTNGTAYTFTVTATNATGTSDPSPASAAATPSTVPNPPTAVSATLAQKTATISWSAPTNDGGAAVTEYVVTSSPGGLTCTTTGALSCAVAGLSDGVNYTFTVVAKNFNGSSAASAASTAVMPTNGSKVPSGLAAPTVTAPASNNSNGQLKVSWKAPTAPNGTVTGYLVTASPGGKTCSTTTELTCFVTGLTNGTAYTFTVKASNLGGFSTASAASAAATPSTVPGVPNSVTATPSASSATVTWTAPTSNGGAAITEYTATTIPSSKTCTTTGALTCVVTGLTDGVNYRVYVTAKNLNGTSAASSTPSVIPGAVPAAPVIKSAAQVAGLQKVTVTWDRPTDPATAPVTGYTVTAEPGGAKCVVGSPTVLTCDFSGLTAGTSYKFSVVATNRVGNSAASAASAAVLVVGPPSEPTNVTADVDPKNKLVDGQAFVTWTAPVNNGGQAIKGYIVTANPGGAFCVAIAPATSCIVKGLTNGTGYKFSVVAVNDPAFSATTTNKVQYKSVAASTATSFTPEWTNQVKQSLVLIPPTGPTEGSTISLLYPMAVTVKFSPTATATNYTVKLNGKVVGTVAASSCVANVCSFTWTPADKYILRTSDLVTVTSSNKLTLSANPSAPASLAVAELHYGSGLSVVNAGSDEAKFLDSVAQLVKDNGYLNVALTGYTDDDGSAKDNLALSGKRATNAGNYLKAALAKLGLTKVTITAVGKGIDKTYASGCKENPVDACAKNRRVMVQVSGQLAAPSTPARVKGTARNNDALLTWVAPNNNGLPITAYTVYYTTEQDYQAKGAPISTKAEDIGNWTVYCTTTTALKCSAGAGVAIANGKSYRFVLVATNAKGMSQVSGVSSAVAPALTAPDAPSVAVSAITKTGLTIAVTAPAYTGGSDITGYAYTVVQGKTVVKTGAVVPGAPVVITGLKKATAYSISVTATNSVGTSSAGTKAITTKK